LADDYGFQEGMGKRLQFKGFRQPKGVLANDARCDLNDLPRPPYGATDEHGIAAVQDKMHINDLHATMLYLLGLDHEKLTYRYSGRDFRLTDLAGVVAKGVVA
jgi:hypothetical protein